MKHFKELSDLEKMLDLNLKTDAELLKLSLKIIKILNDRGVNIREDNKSFESQECEVLDRSQRWKNQY